MGLDKLVKLIYLLVFLLFFLLAGRNISFLYDMIKDDLEERDYVGAFFWFLSGLNTIIVILGIMLICGYIIFNFTF